MNEQPSLIWDTASSSKPVRLRERCCLLCLSGKDSLALTLTATLTVVFVVVSVIGLAAHNLLPVSTG